MLSPPPRELLAPLAILDAVLVIARSAAAAILPHFQASIAVATKGDGSPVTAADHAAEAVILPALDRLLPGVPVISEEAFARGDRPAVGGRFWLVDPVDGTKEFIAGIPEFTVNIALIEERVPLLGVIGAPATGTFYGGLVGTGAWWWPGLDADRQPIVARQPPVEGLIAMVSRVHGDSPALNRFLAPLAVVERRRCGSSLKFCELARGAADLYPRFGPTCEWDTAAGQAILEAAGGRLMTAASGLPLRYGKPDFLNPDFIAHGRRIIDRSCDR